MQPTKIMAKENLIPLNQRSKEEALKIQTAGGKVKSEAKTLANMTRNLKHGMFAKKFTLTVQELAKNPENSALKIFDLVERIGDGWKDLSPKMRMDLAKLYCEAHRTIHGTKQLNLNVNSEIKQDLERWFDEKGD